tara:strand:- start:76 stop:246 length:171 start_codon:yes stop_codon:yes gene_type:complete
LSCIVNIVIPATNPATKLAKTVAKPSYSLVGDLHGMQGVSGSSPLGSISIFASYSN